LPWLFTREVALDDVEEFGGEAVHFLNQYADFMLEVVVGHDGRYGGYKTNGGGDEGFGDAGGYDGQGGGTTFADAFEGGHDAPDGAEEADEGRGGAGGGQEGQVFLQPGDFKVGGASQGTGDVFYATQVGAEDAAVLFVIFLGELPQFAIAFVEEDCERGAGKTIGLGGDGVKAFGFPEQVHEAHRFAVGFVNLIQFEHDDGPGYD